MKTAAAEAGREPDDLYTMVAASVCVLEKGESPTSPRVLERVGPVAMLPFHAYADNPAIGDHLPQPVRDRLPIYESEVLARFGVPRDRLYQETHRGHLSHLLPGEADVLTDDIIRTFTLTGTAREIADMVRRLDERGSQPDAPPASTPGPRAGGGMGAQDRTATHLRRPRSPICR